MRLKLNKLNATLLELYFYASVGLILFITWGLK